MVCTVFNSKILLKTKEAMLECGDLLYLLSSHLMVSQSSGESREGGTHP